MTTQSAPPEFDVIIIGGGAAGQSAALILARCMRRVLVIDEGLPRNRASRSMHNYLSRDGVEPRELLALGRAELETYAVQFRRARAVDASGADGDFRIATALGETFRSRKIVLATGVEDLIPNLPAIHDFYGVSVHHCPYCDAHEHRGRRLAACGEANKSVGLALSLRTWSEDVIAFMDDDAELTPGHRAQAASEGIELVIGPIAHLEGAAGQLERIVIESGRAIERDALFFNTGQRQRSDLAQRLGCEVVGDHDDMVDSRERTCVPGVCLVGDASKDVQFVIVAAAEGAIAGVALNAELQKEDCERRSSEATAQPQ